MKLSYLIDTIGLYIDTKGSSLRWRYDISLILQMSFAGLEPPAQHTKPLYKIIIASYEKKPSMNDASSIGSYAQYTQNCVDHAAIETCYQDEGTTLYLWTSGRVGVIHFFIQQLLRMQQKTFIHAAGISYKGNGILLPAFGGIGKTSLMQYALQQKEVTGLGDDLIILDHTSKMIPHLRPLCLYQYHRTLFPDFFSTHRFPIITQQRILHKIARRLAIITGSEMILDRYIAPFGYTAVPIKSLFSSQQLQETTVPLKHIVLLERRSGLTTPHLKTSLCKKSAARFMVNVIYHELSSALPTLLLSLVSSNQSAGEYLARTEQIITTAIASSAITCAKISLPEHTTTHEVGPAVFNLIEHLYEK